MEVTENISLNSNLDMWDITNEAYDMIQVAVDINRNWQRNLMHALPNYKVSVSLTSEIKRNLSFEKINTKPIEKSGTMQEF